MKLFQRPTQLCIAASLLPYLTNAADCTVPNAVNPWSYVARDMMYSIRNWGCNNAWWRDLKMTNTSPWCISASSTNTPCFAGWFYWHGHPSQQACWDTTIEIIGQCMKAEGGQTWNGGRWSLSGEYAEGWFYNLPSNKKRALDIRAEVAAGNNTVYLNIDEHGNVTIDHDFQVQTDGTVKDLAARD